MDRALQTAVTTAVGVWLDDELHRVHVHPQVVAEHDPDGYWMVPIDRSQPPLRTS